MAENVAGAHFARTVLGAPLGPKLLSLRILLYDRCRIYLKHAKQDHNTFVFVAGALEPNIRWQELFDPPSEDLLERLGFPGTGATIVRSTTPPCSLCHGWQTEIEQ